jgi:ABC-type transporter Mla subunit MlaD
MMLKRAQTLRLGIFIFVSVTALVALIVFFTSQKFLQKKDTYFIAYKGISVGGIEVGSPVKYLGIKMGTVDDIRIDPQDVSRILVKVGLEPGTPVKEDARADIASIGITGLKTIEIRGGSNEANLLRKGEFIPAGSSMTEEITGKAEVIAEKLEKVLNNLQDFTQPENLEKITLMVEKAAAAFSTVDTVLEENRQELAETMVAARKISSRLDSTTLLTHETAARINSIVRSDTLEQILAGARDISAKLQEVQLVNLIKELGEVVERTNRLLIQMDHDFERGSLDFALSMKQLKFALQNFSEASQLIRKDPSVLVRGTKVMDVPDKHLIK